MTEVRNKGNYEQWIRFFLQAIYECAQDAVKTIDELTLLHDKNEETVRGMGRAARNAMQVFHYIEANPIIDIGKTAEALNITFNTASAAVKRLIETGILVQTDHANRNRAFAYEAYLDILKDGT